jgi:hypothetical protein
LFPENTTPLIRLTGEGKETCPEARDEMVNIRKSCLDRECGIGSFLSSVGSNSAKLRSFHVMVVCPFVVGARGR